MIAIRSLFPLCPVKAGWFSNDRLGPWIAWHSPHSLTWSWIARVQFVGPFQLSWSWHRNSVGFGGGIPRWLYVSTHVTNGGRQWDVHAVLCAFSWSRQRPMWFRDLYQKEVDARYERSRQNSLMRQFGGAP